MLGKAADVATAETGEATGLNGERTVATASTTDVDDIRRQMAQIRRELHEDMQGVVAGAEAAFDWQYYVRLYPWAFLAGAAVVGYLVVPKRHKTAREVAEEAVERVQETIAEAAPQARGKGAKVETKGPVYLPREWAVAFCVAPAGKTCVYGTLKHMVVVDDCGLVAHIAS